MKFYNFHHAIVCTFTFAKLVIEYLQEYLHRYIDIQAKVLCVYFDTLGLNVKEGIDV